VKFLYNFLSFRKILHTPTSVTVVRTVVFARRGSQKNTLCGQPFTVSAVIPVMRTHKAVPRATNGQGSKTLFCLFFVIINFKAYCTFALNKSKKAGDLFGRPCLFNLAHIFSGAVTFRMSKLFFMVCFVIDASLSLACSSGFSSPFIRHEL